MRVVIINLDGHLSGTTQRALPTVRRELPGLELSLHAATEWADSPDALNRCLADIAAGDIIMATMLVMEEHFKPILPALAARREQCDAMIVCMSAGELMKLTRMGGFAMDGTPGGPMALLKRLRGNKEKTQSTGAQQMSTLRRIPKLLRFIPGTAQDVRAYFLTLQYWLAGTDDNLGNMVRFLVDRYADGPRRHLRGTLKVAAPAEYPEVGIYHPKMKGHISEKIAHLPVINGKPKGRVGLLLMRSYVLAGNASHYNGVIEALEARGLHVVPAFASGLDARPAIEKFFMQDGQATVDAVVSLTGFSLVGGRLITIPKLPRKYWRGWMCPISPRWRWNSKRSINGKTPIRGCCRLKRR